MLLHVEAPRSFQSLVEDFFEAGTHRTHQGLPAVEVVEDDHQTTIAAELPGVKKEDLKITFEDGVLTLSGTRKPDELNDNTRVLLNERHVREFRRTVRPSHEVEASQIAAQLIDGVLTVTLPKAEKAKARTISVR